MQVQNYQCHFTVPVSAERAFKAINDVASWWTQNTSGTSLSPGDVFTVTFGKTFVTFSVQELIPGRQVIWKIEDSWLDFVEEKEWNGTCLHWQIIPKGDQTEITMVHIGLTPMLACFNQCEKGWDFYAKGSLYRLLTAGEGMPDQRRCSTQEQGK